MIQQLRNGKSGKSRSERRSRANTQKEGLFFDSGRERRMWRLVATLVIVILALALLYVPVVGGLVLLAMDKDLVKVVAVAEHDDAPTTMIGELTPLHGDATEKLLQLNATKDVELVTTVTSYDQLKRNKAAMLNRTADGSAGEDFVRSQFDHAFATYTDKHVEPLHIDCQLEGQYQGPSKSARFDCFYYLAPASAPAVTGAPTSLAPTTGDDRNAAVRYESHVEVVQSRGATDAAILYDNPDEIYLTSMTQQRLLQ